MNVKFERTNETLFEEVSKKKNGGLRIVLGKCMPKQKYFRK